MRLEVGGLSELFVAAVEGADVGPVAGVNAHVRAQVKVQGEALAAAFERALEGFLSRVHQLMPLQFGTLHEGFATLGAHVHARPVRVQVLPHRGVVPEHLGTSFVRTGYCPRRLVLFYFLRLHPRKLCQLLGIREVDARDATGRKLLPRHVLGVIGRGVISGDLLFMVDVLFVVCNYYFNNDNFYQ